MQDSAKSLKLKSCLQLCEEPGSCEVSEHYLVDAGTQIFSFPSLYWEASTCRTWAYPLLNEYPGFPEGSTCILCRWVILNDWPSWGWRPWPFNWLLWCQSAGILDLVCYTYLKSQASVTLVTLLLRGLWVLGLIGFKLTRLTRRKKSKSSVSLLLVCHISTQRLAFQVLM